MVGMLFGDCFAANEGKQLIRKECLDPKIVSNGKKIEVYGAKIEDQNYGRLKCHFSIKDLKDFSCMFRAYRAMDILLEGKGEGDSLYKLKTELGKPFCSKLKFDSFVYPELFSGISKSMQKDILYFNFSVKKPPFAGHPMMTKEANEKFGLLKNIIKNNIEKKENRQKYTNPALCFGSDYKELLHHIRAMNATQGDYQFGVVSTKFGGEFGHALAIFVRQEGADKPTQFICLDGANLIEKGNSGYFSEMIGQLSEMIINPTILENYIVQYLCAVKPCDSAAAEIEELGLQDNELYKTYYMMAPGVSHLELHKAFRQAELLLSHNTSDETELKKPFLNCLDDCGSQTSADVYVSICENANSEENISLDLDSGDERKNLQKTALHIVYLKRIMEKRVFDASTQQYKKLLALLEGNDLFAIVMNSFHKKDNYSVFSVDPYNKVVQGGDNASEAMKTFLTKTLFNSKKLAKEIKQSICAHYSPELAKYEVDSVFKKNSWFNFGWPSFSHVKQASRVLLFLIAVVTAYKYCGHFNISGMSFVR